MQVLLNSSTEAVSDEKRSWQNFNHAKLPFLTEPIIQVVTFGSLCITKKRVISFCSDEKIPKRFETYNPLFDWMVPLNYTYTFRIIGGKQFYRCIWRRTSNYNSLWWY
jgi:hypothetical protein